MTVDARSQEEIRDEIVSSLEDDLDDPATDDIDVLGALSSGVSDAVEESEVKLAEVSTQTYLASATGQELTNRASDFGINRQPAVQATGVVEFSRESPAPTDFTIQEGTTVQTLDGSVSFSTTEEVVLSEGDTTVKANVKADEGGTDGNLPSQKLEQMPSPPTGVEEVTNLIPTGDPDFDDTNGDPLVAGEDEENDEELRARALDARNIGGTATANSIRSELLNVTNVRSVKPYVNADDTTDGRGLPPYSSETLVNGGDKTEIAKTLRDTMSVTDLFRTQGGIIGSGVTVSVYVESLDQNVDVEFSRPLIVTLTVDVEVNTMDTYEGDDTLTDSIIDYVGGTYTDGSDSEGLDAGENVILGRIEDAITGTETGVNGIATLSVTATDSDGNTVSQQTINGIEQIPINREQQASLDAADVTVTTV